MILREKILLGLVGVAAIGAGIMYVPALINPPAAKSKREPVDFPTLRTKVQLNLKEGESTDREERVLAAATTKWLRNPLGERPLTIDPTVEPTTAPPKYVIPLPKYVGFLSSGNKLIAIIDGHNYSIGDAIEGGEFTLSQIHAEYVQLLRRGANDPVNVPLEKPQSAELPQSIRPPEIVEPMETPEPLEIIRPSGILGPPGIIRPPENVKPSDIIGPPQISGDSNE